MEPYTKLSMMQRAGIGTVPGERQQNVVVDSPVTDCPLRRRQRRLIYMNITGNSDHFGYDRTPHIAASHGSSLILRPLPSPS
jgi:hypothetical protein